MRDVPHPATGPGEASARTAFAVRVEAVGASTPRRARLAVAIWTIGLAMTAWIGLAGHDDGGAAKPVVAPAAAALPTTAATPAADDIPATATPPLSRGTVQYISAVAIRNSFGEDGLMGGIVFGNNVPSSKVQADVERDGYRRYFVP
jgi:hypothetical protein